MAKIKPKPGTEFQSALAAVAADADRDRVLSFILQQADRLRQQRADAEAQRVGRLARREFHRRWGPRADAVADRIAAGDIVVDATAVNDANRARLKEEKPDNHGTPTVYNVNTKSVVDTQDSGWLEALTS